MSAVLNVLYTLWNQILYALSNVRVFDIIDIAVIAWIIYKAIGFLRETRAGQLVKGLSVLIIIYLIAIWFKLAVLRWLLSAVMDSAIIAIAVIFQPEIRRALERVGQVRLGRTHMLDNDEERITECIEQICKAAGNMQESKTGALIVFERKTQLGEIINTGTVVDAVPSAELVGNIFFTKSPLHDGAMIVRDGKIYAAGCILPLTQSNVFSSQLGTRHRAAIGMTENSDAVVLVVSEETGIISLVMNGQITRNYTGVSACAELKRLLVENDVEERDSKLFSAFKSLKPFSHTDNRKDGQGEEK